MDGSLLVVRAINQLDHLAADNTTISLSPHWPVRSAELDYSQWHGS
jgi:hypothetical protein